jgi:hypothetical protein
MSASSSGSKNKPSKEPPWKQVSLPRDYITTPSVSRLYGVGWNGDDEWWVIKDLEGSGRVLIEVLSRDLIRGTENLHCYNVKPSSGAQRNFIKSLSRAQVKNEEWFFASSPPHAWTFQGLGLNICSSTRTFPKSSIFWKIRPCSPVRIFRRNISPPSSGSTSKPSRKAAWSRQLVSCLVYSFTLKMEVTLTRTTRHYNPGDRTVHSRCKNLTISVAYVRVKRPSVATATGLRVRFAAGAKESSLQHNVQPAVQWVPSTISPGVKWKG